jgi:hypothetical protein
MRPIFAVVALSALLGFVVAIGRMLHLWIQACRADQKKVSATWANLAEPFRWLRSLTRKASDDEVLNTATLAFALKASGYTGSFRPGREPCVAKPRVLPRPLRRPKSKAPRRKLAVVPAEPQRATQEYTVLVPASEVVRGFKPGAPFGQARQAS